MVAVPDTIPDTTPELPPTLIIEDGLEKVPPVGEGVKVLVAPVQTLGVPDTAIAGLTVNVNVASAPHGLGTVYVIVAVPAAPAVTTPVDVPIDATEGLLLLHVPPAAPVGLESVVVPPKQSTLLPVITPGPLHNCVIII